MVTEPLSLHSAPTNLAQGGANNPSEIHVADILGNIAQGILVTTCEGNCFYSNPYAHWINSQLMTLEPQSKEIASVIWEVCQTFMNVCYRTEDLTHISDFICQTSLFPSIRIRVSWISAKTFSEPLLLINLEDQSRVTHQTALFEAKHYQLTQRETEVWLLRSKGYRYEQIAQRLYISHNTVKRHLKSIFAKREVVQLCA